MVVIGAWLRYTTAANAVSRVPIWPMPWLQAKGLQDTFKNKNCSQQVLGPTRSAQGPPSPMLVGAHFYVSEY